MSRSLCPHDLASCLKSFDDGCTLFAAAAAVVVHLVISCTAAAAAAAVVQDGAALSTPAPSQGSDK